MEEWNIQSRSHVCTTTGEPFKDGDQIVSMLFLGANGYQRKDYSQQAWREFVSTPDTSPTSYWQTRYFPPAPPVQESLKKDDVEGLLRKLVDENNPETINTRYILAVMLERKRILKQIDTFRNDLLGKVIVYEHLKTGESFTVNDPELRLDQIEKVQHEVIGMIGGKAPASALKVPASTQEAIPEEVSPDSSDDSQL